MPPHHLTYLEIADDLQSRIRSGEYPPGTALPSRATLAELYSVSVASIKRAFTVLRVRGLVYDVDGMGVFVADQ